MLSPKRVICPPKTLICPPKRFVLFLFPNSVAHYWFVNEVQSAQISRIRLVVVRLGIIDRCSLINNFKPTLKTFYHHLNDLV